MLRQCCKQYDIASNDIVKTYKFIIRGIRKLLVKHIRTMLYCGTVDTNISLNCGYRKYQTCKQYL